jgi:micrococcal nuclease
MRSAVLAGVAVLALGGCRGNAGAAIAPPATGAVAANATVEWVVDGDTIDVTVDGREERVRLIGIDTPEIPHDDDVRPAQPGECFGTEAQEFTAALLPVGTPVRLERDVVGRDDTAACWRTCTGRPTGCSSTTRWSARATPSR